MEELLDIVNNTDAVVGLARRSVIHQCGLQHRGAHVFLFSGDGKMLVQKRSADRSASPSMLDCSVSEHVKAGESYLDAALRGMKEEMGVTDVEISPLVTFRMNYGLNDNEISTLYMGQVTPEIVRFDPVEIAEIGYYSLDQLEELMRDEKNKFCGWFIQIMNWYLKKPSEMIVLDS